MQTHPFFSRYVFVAALLLVVPTLRAALSVEVPKGWQEYALPAEAQLATREFEGAGERNCLIDINVAGVRGKALQSFADVPLALRALTAKMTSPALEGFKEVEVKKGSAHFLYSSYEDPQFKGKKLDKGKFHCVTRVVGLWDEKNVVVASLFTDTLKGPDFEEGLALLQSLTIDTNQEIKGPSHTLTCQPFRAKITFPPEVPLSRDGETDKNHHFQIQYPGTSVVASGWLAKSKGAENFDLFWASEKKKLSMIMPISDETREEVAGWSVVFYTVHMGPVNHVNVRCSKVSDGILYDLHLSSVGGPEKRDLLRKILTATQVGRL